MGRLLSLSLACFVFTGLAWAQENDTVFYHGTVMKVSGTTMVISEYDYEQSKQVEMTYTLDPKAKTEYVESIRNIQPGNAVGFYYTNRKGKYTIFKVIVYEEPEAQPSLSPPPAPQTDEGGELKVN